MNLKKTLLISISAVVIACFMAGCGAIMRPSRVAINAKIGSTTREQVVRRCGQPYKMTSSRGADNALVESLYYKEDVSGVSNYYSGNAAVTHIFTFTNGVLERIDHTEDVEVIEKIIRHE